MDPLSVDPLPENATASGAGPALGVAVTAASCHVQPPHYILKLRPRGNSAPCWFQITPHRPGKQSIVVTAYQQDDALAAQTRLSIEVQVPVSPTA